jgi:very-short-patch-repair endonuclease
LHLKRYCPQLKENARSLRSNMTESEQRLWSRLRGKELLGVQFYRQKPLGGYIVDFYAPKASLVVEVDGSQHQEDDQVRKDAERDRFLAGLDLQVLRFDSRQVLTDTEAVMESIFRVVDKRLKG